MTFIVQYGMNQRTRRPHRRRVITHRNFQLEVDLPSDPLEDASGGEALRSLLLARHPGWNLTGYTCKEV